MQNQLLKFVLFFLLIPSTVALANDLDDQEILNKADTLFASSRYTESLEYYNQLHLKGLNSAAMLLKMAYIHEGLESYPDALYFLNLYFLKSNDLLALQKMNELAAKQRISGYDTFATDRIYGFYQRNFFLISMIFMSACVLILSLGAYQKRKTKLNYTTFLSMLCVFILALALHINFGSKWKQGVVFYEKAVLMKGPSAASGVLGTANRGTRFEIVNKKDSWLVIRTENGRGYLRESALRLIEL